MVRAAGALLLAAAGLWAGLERGAQQTRRVRALGEWVQALDLWGWELAYRLPTTAQLLATLAQRGPVGPGQVAGRALEGLGERDFDTIWQAALTAGEKRLAEQEMERLKGLGAVLGGCGWEDQRSAIDRAARWLERRGEELSRDLARERKTWGVLGLSAGCALAIMLL